MESQVVLSEDCKCFAPINAMLSPVLPASNEWKHPALLDNRLLKRRFAIFCQAAGKEIKKKKRKKKKIPLLPALGAWLWVNERWAGAFTISICGLVLESLLTLCRNIPLLRSQFLSISVVNRRNTLWTQGIWWTLSSLTHSYMFIYTFSVP